LGLRLGLIQQYIKTNLRRYRINHCDWLRSQSGRAILLQQAGILADDDSLAELRATIYQARGRSEINEESDV
jgi:hypothetical protein